MTKLLIVDDERIIREDLALNLPWRQHGIELVTPAGNGREAVEVIEREKPDIVLADINMPVMDGLEVAVLLAGKMRFPCFLRGMMILNMRSVLWSCMCRIIS